MSQLTFREYSLPEGNTDPMENEKSLLGPAINLNRFQWRVGDRDNENRFGIRGWHGDVGFTLSQFVESNRMDAVQMIEG